MIKKSVCLFFTCVFIFMISLSASADIVDVSSLSDEDLLALKEQVLTEIAVRHLEDSVAFGYWFDFGLGKILPNPKEVFGRDVKQYTPISNNDDTWFSDNLDDVTLDEFNAYVAALRLYGFNDQISASGISFEADNVDGIHVNVSLIGKVMFIDLK